VYSIIPSLHLTSTVSSLTSEVNINNGKAFLSVLCS
jgi:hypothetical protein